MSRRWIVTAAGGDKPGIVAAVTEVLYKIGANLEDSAMNRLEGEFAIMLIFSVPAAATGEKLAKAFAGLEKKMKLAVHLKPLSAAETRAPAKNGSLHVISVYGADKPGIVYAISRLLAQGKVNITNVQTHRSHPAHGSKTPSLYLLLLEVEVPARTSGQALEKRLKHLAKKLGVEVTLRAAEAAVL